MQGLSVVKQDRGKDLFDIYRPASEDTAMEIEDCLTLKEYSHSTAMFTPLGSSEFAAGALGLWGRLAVGEETFSWCKMVLG